MSCVTHAANVNYRPLTSFRTHVSFNSGNNNPVYVLSAPQVPLQFGITYLFSVYYFMEHFIRLLINTN